MLGIRVGVEVSGILSRAAFIACFSTSSYSFSLFNKYLYFHLFFLPVFGSRLSASGRFSAAKFKNRSASAGGGGRERLRRRRRSDKQFISRSADERVAIIIQADNLYNDAPSYRQGNLQNVRRTARVALFPVALAAPSVHSGDPLPRVAHRYPLLFEN